MRTTSPLTFLVAFLLLSASAQDVASGPSPSSPAVERYLVGGEKGLALATMEAGQIEVKPLLEDATVEALVPCKPGWFLLGSTGLLFTPDLKSFEDRSVGLPQKTLLVETQGTFVPERTPMELKGLAVDPRMNGRLAAITATEVLVSDDWGSTWRSLKSPTSIPGYKAVSFGPLPGKTELGLWVSNSIKGLFARDFLGESPWTSLSAGLPLLSGAGPEEVANLALMPDDKGGWKLFGGTSFLGRLYEWDELKSSFMERFSDGKDFGYVESLSPGDKGAVVGLTGGAIGRFFPSGKNGRWLVEPDLASTDRLKAAAAAARETVGTVLCAAKLSAATASTRAAAALVANEFWRLAPPETSPRIRLASGKKALYLQTGFVLDPKTRRKYFDLMGRLGLDAIVVDLKDDSGRLRFQPRSPLLQAEGSVGDAIDLEDFAAEVKARGIYLVGRIVVFKDSSLYAWNAGALAVQDGKKGGPWRGLKKDGSLIDELWADPYSPEVWRYNVEIAREATERGFDEVQFDYIRFPTDGVNLDDAVFASNSEGLAESEALESFLQYARSGIQAPVSVDIYGSNGWYRSGSRTGQDVEMLARHVDVICPMFYPSHFEQGFQAHPPTDKRPYRIYKLGSLRTAAISRGQVAVRPYVQSFYLDVSYDRQYYGSQYVQDEVRGVLEGANQGMTFWNNVGRYDEVPVLR